MTLMHRLLDPKVEDWQPKKVRSSGWLLWPIIWRDQQYWGITQMMIDDVRLSRANCCDEQYLADEVSQYRHGNPGARDVKER